MKKLIPLLLLILAAAAGYFGYSYYFSPEKVLSRAIQRFSNLNTVHGEMNIDLVVRLNQPQALGKSVQQTLSGFSDINIKDKTQKTHMTLTTQGKAVDMDFVLLKDGEMYMKSPVLSQSWLSLNSSALKEKGLLTVDPQANDYVTQSLGFMKSVEKGSIVKLEDEIVDGVKTTKFRVDISTPRYMEFMKALGINQSVVDGIQDATVKSTIWVSRSTGNIVAMETEVKNVKIYQPGTSNLLGSSDYTIKLTYSRYDQTIDVSKPAGEAIPYEEFLKQAGDAKSPSNP